MSDNEFEPFKVPALGRAIARAFVTFGAALRTSWRAIYPKTDERHSEQTDYTHWVTRYAWFLVPFWLFFSGAVFLSLLQLYYAPLPDDAVEIRWRALALTALLTALGALVAAPLTIIRVYVNERQAKTAEEGLITDRITKAIEQLGAEKTVKTTVDKQRIVDGGIIFEQVVDERTEPNLEVRLGAIYALERIAEDSERDHIPIMETLCAYIRENSKMRVAEDFPEEPWAGLEDYSDKAAREAHLEKRRERFGDDVLESKAANWVRKLTGPRADIQAALSVVGRRSEDRLAYEAAQERPFQLDLRTANLQGADMSNLRFGPALLDEARLEGADLSDSNLNGAEFNGTKLEGADLIEAELNCAYFIDAEMECARFMRAEMQEAELGDAKMEGADFRWSDMRSASFFAAEMEGANFGRAKMGGVKLYEAQMEGANLSGAEMEGANLGGAVLKSADLANCTFARTFARSADFSEAKAMSQDQVNALFGDTDTGLPHGLKRTTELNHAPLEYPWDDDPEHERWKAAGYPEGEVLEDE